MTNENLEKTEPILETFPKTESVIDLSGLPETGLVPSVETETKATIDLSGLPETGLVPSVETETKATIDGVWIVDGRLAVCDTEQEAIKLYKACFQNESSAIPSDRFPAPGEKVLHLRDSIPVYGRPE